MECYTSNDNWEQSVLDRSNPDNANIPFKKCAKLKGISLYSFVPNSKNFLSESKFDYILEPGIVLMCRVVEFEAHFTHDAASDLKFRIELLTEKISLKLSLIHICRCRRYAVCRSRWSPYH
eukprot:TRINITY_DN11662_c0_g1_i12.p2 TRINITY_DN11662_c0_g1~~TRINITY_DN11662_c0_g1_i12.p2  ORF type:complete len:121 (-),score=13.24 TRINITY_DN11662_c0_g1_i12:31-393(-)